MGVANTVVATYDPLVADDENTNDNRVPPQVAYDEEKGEVGGFGNMDGVNRNGGGNSSNNSNNNGITIGKVDYRMKVGFREKSIEHGRCLKTILSSPHVDPIQIFTSSIDRNIPNDLLRVDTLLRNSLYRDIKRKGTH